MSIPVDLDQLAAAMREHATAFLVTVNDDLRVHAVQVHPVLEGGALRIAEPGRRTAANLAVRPDVTVLFPPYEPGGYTLIVDGRAAGARGSAGVAVEVTAAVLHRAVMQQVADPKDPAACINDCVPLDQRRD